MTKKQRLNTCVGDAGSSFLSDWLYIFWKASRCVGTGIGSEIGKKLGLVGLANGSRGSGGDLIGSLNLKRKVQKKRNLYFKINTNVISLVPICH